MSWGRAMWRLIMSLGLIELVAWMVGPHWWDRLRRRR